MNTKSLYWFLGCMVIVFVGAFYIKSWSIQSQEAATINSAPGVCVSNPALTVTKDPSSPSAGTVNQGQVNIPFLNLSMKAGNCAVRLASLTVYRTGTWSATDMSALKLYNNGTQIGSNAQVVGNGYKFNNVNASFTPGQVKTLEVRVDINNAPLSTVGHAGTLQIHNAADISLVYSASGNVAPVAGAFAIDSSTKTIVAGTTSVTTNAATSITTTSAKLNASAIPSTFGVGGAGWFMYGTSPAAMTSTTPPQTLATSFSQTASGLANNTTYYFRGCAQNALQTLQMCGATLNFMSLPGPMPDLSVATLQWQDMPGVLPGNGVVTQAHYAQYPNSFAFSMKLKNNGSAPLSNQPVNVKIYKGSVAPANLVTDITTPVTIAAGATSNYNTVSAVSPGLLNLMATTGTFPLVMVVDGNNVIPETNENNNTFTTSMTVTQ